MREVPIGFEKFSLDKHSLDRQREDQVRFASKKHMYPVGNAKIGILTQRLDGLLNSIEFKLKSDCRSAS